MIRRILFRKRQARARTVVGLVGAIIAMGLFLRIGDVLESKLFYLPRPGAFATPMVAEDVWFENDDGQRLHGWWFPATTTEPIGTILYCHGNAGALPDHFVFMAALPRLGFNVMIFDYRGFGQSESPGSPLKRNMLIADTSAALDAVMSRPDVDPSRVVVIGHSMGAMAASNMVALRGEATGVRALAMISGFSSWSGVASDHVGPLAHTLLRNHASPQDAVADIGAIPLLIMHGELDRVVKSRHASILADAAKANGVAAELLLLSDADHESVLAIAANQQRVAAFFERALDADD